MSVLASDSLLGRAPGTPGDRAARRYIEAQLREFDVQPGARGAFEQIVPMHRSRMTDFALALDMEGVRALDTVNAAQVSAMSADSVVTVAGDLVWVGFGIDAPDHGWTDYGSTDVSGKIAVAITGIPAALRARQGYAGTAYYGHPGHKEHAARSRGAAGLILLVPRVPDARWNYFARQDANRSFTTVLLDTAEVSTAMPMVRDLLSTVDSSSPTTARVLPGRPSLTLRQHVAEATSANVVGVIPGRTPEWIMLVAHHDGLGIGRPDTVGDSVYNGAQDNALGVALALCVAQRASTLRTEGGVPERGLIVLFTAAEERGHLGAAFWARRPTHPPSAVRLAINLDAIGVAGPTQDVLAYGSSTLMDLDALQGAARSAGSSITQTAFQTNMYFAFDASEFAAVGIPAVTIGQGTTLPGLTVQQTFQRLGAFQRRYHTPSDELRDDWEAAAIAHYLAVADSAVTHFLRGAAAPQLRPNGPYVPLGRARQGASSGRQ